MMIKYFGLDMPRFDRGNEEVEWRLYFLDKRRYRYVPYSSSAVAISSLLYHERHGQLCFIRKNVSVIRYQILP